MTIVFPLQAARREVHFRLQPVRRATRSSRPGPSVLEAARHFDLDARAQLDAPRRLLIRAVGRLERSDWAILFTVAMAFAALLVLGVLGMRLASISPAGATAPRTAPAASATQPFEVLAPPAAAPAAAPAPTAVPTPAAPPAQAISTVDAGSPGAGARLRAEPRLEAKIVERIVHGTQVTEIGPEASDGQRTWRQIKSATGTVGWMDASLLRRRG